MLGELGLSPRPFKPALSPLYVNSSSLKALRGVRVGCALELVKSGSVLRREIGELQFTEHALSGIAVFGLSSVYSRLSSPRGVFVRADLFPEMSESELQAMLGERLESLPHLERDDFLSGLLPKRIGTCLIRESTQDSSKALSPDDIKLIAERAKGWMFEVTGGGNWNQAQAASGGLPLSALDDNLQSKKYPGLYVCGELLDCDGDCGGHNLRWAWTTGILAGRLGGRR